ncbi:bifunctional precorrin-2 dehydrogenase/sirohydrochlorin ferrochelatase [Nitrospirota bacterium]
MSRKTPKYYPAFLDLTDRPCVIVGGGKVAERKALELIKAGAKVTVISPTLTSRLEKEKQKGTILHHKRKVRNKDLDKAFFVFAATDSPEVNEEIANRKDLLVNVADHPELCDFIVPSSIKRGPLHIAVSTSGYSPAMSRAIRKDMEPLYGPAFGTYLSKLKALRAKAIKEITDPEERKIFLKELASEKVINTLRKGKQPAPPRTKKK